MPAEAVRPLEQPAAVVAEPMPIAPAPISVPAPAPVPARRRRRGPALVLLGLALLALGGAWWWQRGHNGLPPGIVWSNGRLEADAIDIATKFPGRIAEILAEEGDLVAAGQILARMDVRDLEAQHAKAEAQLGQAQRALDAARAEIEQARAQARLAGQELDRARFLFVKGHVSKELLDQRQAQMDSAAAAQRSAQARAAQAEQTIAATRQDIAMIKVNIADNVLTAPKDGRVQYRLANVGEVLGAGGKVFSLLDTGNVYLDAFLPTAEAGRLSLGTEARILLDALPGAPIPAKVAFIDPQAQFTPKQVETRSERDKLMFRVRVRVERELLRAHAAEVRSGLPGLAYFRLDPNQPWPASLEPKPRT